MPYLKNIQTDYAEQGVKIVAINAKEDEEGDPAAYAEGLGFPAIAVAGGDAIAEAYAVQYIPGLFVVDGEGIGFSDGIAPGDRKWHFRERSPTRRL